MVDFVTINLDNIRHYLSYEPSNITRCFNPRRSLLRLPVESVQRQALQGNIPGRKGKAL
ncbi:hypothetical protein [Aetokthonos hydrillicola]|uniref:hypothetical protein n=1 Tax=Aetokthonos hydrillicola TaxID=1550245 RepID=UPI001FBBE1C9|nr:hypothetical protein [Aetokthonos hydrillicola]